MNLAPGSNQSLMVSGTGGCQKVARPFPRFFARHVLKSMWRSTSSEHTLTDNLLEAWNFHGRILVPGSFLGRVHQPRILQRQHTTSSAMDPSMLVDPI